MIPRDKIAVLLPVYNEALHLEEVIVSILREKYHLLVVDDGSTDDSGKLARRLGTEVIENSANRGKGYSLRLGFERLVAKGYDWIVIMDSDGQHLAQDIPRFIIQAESGSFGVINGSRLHAPRKMPLIRLWTNRVMSWIVSLVARQRIEDCQCGFKMLSAAFLRRAKLESDKFEIEDEILLEAARLDYRIGSVPVTSAYGVEKSHIRPLHDTLRFFGFLITRFGKSRQGSSRS